jgi:hypothetical protein
VRGTLIPQRCASASCTDLFLIVREAEYLLTQRTGSSSSAYNSESENQRYSLAANFRSASETLGFALGRSGLRIQTTSPACNSVEPRQTPKSSDSEMDARRSRCQPEPGQQTTA